MEEFKSGERIALTNIGGELWDWLPCPHNSPQEDSVRFGMVFDKSKMRFMKVDAYGNWIACDQRLAKSHLQLTHKLSASTKAADRTPIVSGVDIALFHVHSCQSVEWAGKLAGYTPGIYPIGEDKRILIVDKPRIITPQESEHPTIDRLLGGMFLEHERLFFCWWLKCAYHALTHRAFTPGPLLTLVGPPDCGKTFLQEYVITPIVGGRSGKPYQYMVGETPFNSDFAATEHLSMGDEKPHPDYARRVVFGSKIKDLIVNGEQRIHPKHCEPFTAKPFWRMSISLNEDADSLLVIPPMEVGMMDKIMLLKVKRPDCFPSSSDDRQQFLERVQKEIPAFIATLCKMEIPADKQSGRMGVIHYHNPEILAELNAMNPEQEIIGIMQAASLFKTCNEWQGTAGDLFEELSSHHRIEVQKRFSIFAKSSVWLGRKLRKLCQANPEFYSYKIHGKQSYFTLRVVDA